MITSCPTRVLVADTDLLAAFGLRAQLSVLGHNVVAEAIDAQEVVSLARAFLPDVVVMSVEMMSVDWLEASRQIDRERLCPIVLLDQDGGAFRHDLFSLSAVQACLIKSVNGQALEVVIELALARFRQLEWLEREVVLLRDALGIRSTGAPASEPLTLDRDRRVQRQQQVRAGQAGLGKVA